jgi:RND family efflux transporter MFP subunit
MQVQAETAGDAPAEPATAVEVQEMRLASLEHRQSFIGRVEAASTVSVVSKLAAEVTGVFVEVGDHVEEGQLLFTVDSTGVQDQIRQLEAGIAAANLGISAAQLGVENARFGLSTAQAGSAQAEMSQHQASSGASQANAAVSDARDGVRSAEAQLRNAEAATARARQQLQAATAATVGVDADQLAKAIRDHANAQARLEKAEEDLAAADTEEALAPATAEYAAALANLTKAGIDLQHAMAGGDSGAVAAASTAFQSALAAQMMAEATVDAARTGHRRAQTAATSASTGSAITADIITETQEQSVTRAQLGVQQAQLGVQQAQAGVNVSNVQLSIAQTSLGYAEVRSPIAGVVSNRMLEVGQMVSPQMPPITVVNMDAIFVNVGVSESLINSIKPGDKVEVTVQAVSDTPFIAQVAVVYPVAAQTGTYTVKVEIPNPEGLIRPGMFAQASFVKDYAANAFVLNMSAVLEDSGERFVYVVIRDTAVKTPVTLGVSDGERVEVRTGLSAGDRVVVTGQEFLRHDMNVNVIAER